MGSLPRIEVNIWSDVACPWCWVGMQRYKKATASLTDRAVVDTKFHAYMIDPATKKEGEDYMDYNTRRWGSDGWTNSLRRSGKPDGALFADWRHWPNTLKAHQLITIADEGGLGPAAKEALLRATYEEGRNVSSKEALLQVAETVGIQDAGSKLEDISYKQKVLQSDQQAKQELGIHGVPHFVIGSGKRAIALHGAQSTESLQRALFVQLT